MSKHNVTIKQIREVKSAKELIAYADVSVDGMFTLFNFKLFRKGHDYYYVYNPQPEDGGTYMKVIEFLDWELEEEVQSKIIAAYKKKSQSHAVSSEEYQEEIHE